MDKGKEHIKKLAILYFLSYKTHLDDGGVTIKNLTLHH